MTALCLGFTASTIAGAAAYPIETVTARYQASVPPASSSSNHRGVLRCIRQVMARKGTAALWRGYHIQLGTGSSAPSRCSSMTVCGPAPIEVRPLACYFIFLMS